MSGWRLGENFLLQLQPAVDLISDIRFEAKFVPRVQQNEDFLL